MSPISTQDVLLVFKLFSDWVEEIRDSEAAGLQCTIDSFIRALELLDSNSASLHPSIQATLREAHNILDDIRSVIEQRKSRGPLAKLRDVVNAEVFDKSKIRDLMERFRRQREALSSLVEAQILATTNRLETRFEEFFGTEPVEASSIPIILGEAQNLDSATQNTEIMILSPV